MSESPRTIVFECAQTPWWGYILGATAVVGIAMLVSYPSPEGAILVLVLAGAGYLSVLIEGDPATVVRICVDDEAKLVLIEGSISSSEPVLIPFEDVETLSIVRVGPGWGFKWSSQGDTRSCFLAWRASVARRALSALKRVETRR